MDRISEFATAFLLNAAWQVAVVALAAAVCARLLRDAAARYRHALWVAALVLSLALPLWGLLDSTGGVSHARAGGPDGADRTRGDMTAAPDSQPAPAVASAAQDGGLVLDRLLQRRRQPVAAAPGLSLALALGYVLFVLWRAGVLWRAWRRAQGFRRSAVEREIPAPLAAVAARCRDTFGLRSVALLCSAQATSPVTVGAREPVILLPENFYAERSEETLASVLGHEMAHVARRDFALNVVYELLCLPVSFHPLARFIKRQLDRTRELACDDLVTERVLEPGAYARSLVRVAGALVSPAGRAFTLGVFDADILEERIMRLTRNTRRLGARAARLLALSAFSLLCLTCLAVSTFSFDLRTGGASAPPTAGADESAADGTRAGVSPRSRPEARAQDGGGAAATRAEAARALNSTDARERAAAACAAGKSGAVGSIPALVAMLGDDTPTEPLRCWGVGSWSPALDTFKQPSPGEQSAIALASMGAPAVEPLTKALDDANPSVRRNAAWAVGELTNMRGDDRANAVAPLVSLLQDSDEWVRMAAARALGEIKDGRAAEKLTALLSDGQWRVRELAAWALGEMKERGAVETLCSVLVSDAQAEVRTTAAWALGEIQSRKAVSSLKQALSDPEPRVRAKARWALSEIEDEDG